MWSDFCQPAIPRTNDPKPENTPSRVVRQLETNDPSLRAIHKNMFGTKFRIGEALALVDALRSNTNLAQLDVCGLFEFASVGDIVKAIAEVLKQNKTITALRIDKYFIGDDGAAALGDAIRTNATLQSVSLCGCGIGNEGAKAIAQALEYNRSIQFLDLRDNFFRCGGAAVIQESLDRNKALMYCFLREERENVAENNQILGIENKKITTKMSERIKPSGNIPAFVQKRKNPIKKMNFGRIFSSGKLDQMETGKSFSTEVMEDVSIVTM